MRKTLALLASAALMGLTLAAHADTIFNINGTTQKGGTFTGTVLIDTVGGAVDGGSIVVNDPTYRGANTNPLAYSYTSSILSNINIEFTDGRPNSDYFDFVLSSSLIGYTGGQICTNCVGNNYYSAGNGQGKDALVSGTLSLPVAATPEPSSLVLLGTGILGFAGAARRRFLQA